MFSEMGFTLARNRCSPVAVALMWTGLSLLGATAASGQVAGAPKTPPPLKPNLQQSCTTTECHQSIIKHTVLHNAAAADCSACHLQTGDPKAHKFSYPVAKDELCLKCHQLPTEKHLHKPMVEGKCTECHDPHGSEHKAQLKGDPNRDLCVRCHNAEFMKKPFVHGPVAVGACATCHKPHSSNLPHLLSADANSLCKTCHADTGKEEAGVHVHKALDQGCVSCHDPHASTHKFQLIETAPKLCLSCHQDKFNQITAGATVVHGAVTDEGGCSSCHEPHASKLAGLQRTTQPQTCLKCHDKPLKTTEGKSLTNMSLLLANNPDKHGPIRDGQCTACHDPHAGKLHNLLSEDYPSTFYSPFSMDMYKLCFKCHEPALVTRMNGQGVTQFRDGGRNLHALHVNQEKGRTCRACHEVHASKRPAHVRESVPFGSSTWMLEINFEKGEQGGSCAPGCHAPKKYDRINAIGPTTTTTPAATAAAEATKPAPAPLPAPAATTPVTPPESKP